MATTEHPVDHPLDPLVPGEIETTREVLEGGVELSERTRYVEIDLDEPTKEELRRYDGEDETVDRRSSIVVRDKEAKATYEGVVSISEEELLAWEQVPDAQPRMIGEELGGDEAVVKANEAFREADESERGANGDFCVPHERSGMTGAVVVEEG